MDTPPLLSPAERAAVASIPARIEALTEEQRLAIDLAYDRLKPRLPQIEADRAHAEEVRMLRLLGNAL